MQEVLAQIIDYIKGIWIKRRYIMIATWLICPIGWLIVAQLPNIYESEAKVYVDTQSLLRPLLRGLTVETNPEMQVQLMVKTLLSRPNLERISRMTDLDVQAKSPEEYEKILDRLKKDLKISRSGRENIYTISIEDKDPEMAKNIVQSALTVFIENTLGETRNDSDTAEKFLDTQIKEYESRLLAAEARLTDFKQKYADVLPNQSGGYYGQLNAAKERLKAIELELLETKTKLASAKSQIMSNANAADSVQNKIQNGNTIRTAYDDRIAELEATLDSLQLRYTDQHPDVKEAKRRLDYLNKQREEEIQKYLEATKNNDGSTVVLSQSPVLQEAQIQVNTLENQVASLNVRAQSYRDQVKELESKIHTLPEIEAEFTALNRDYGITKQKYEELLNRKETAKLAKQADETTDKIQFRVIDPPRAASEPSGPPRILLFIVVTIFGIGVGIGLSLLMSQLSPVVTSASQLTKATGIPMFGIVSANENAGLHRWHRKKTYIFMASNTLLFIILLLFISYFLFPDAIQAPLKRML
jgi:polysaccharide chain length determinant protein (PEP-CTERM system associated)